MDLLRGLFRKVPVDNQAAFVVGIVQQSVFTITHTDSTNVRASSVSRGVCIIQVAHPALAARIQQNTEEILAQANTKISTQLPGQPPITKIVCRVTELQ